jgi:hypothetical protein
VTKENDGPIDLEVSTENTPKESVDTKIEDAAILPVASTSSREEYLGTRSDDNNHDKDSPANDISESPPKNLHTNNTSHKDEQTLIEPTNAHILIDRSPSRITSGLGGSTPHRSVPADTDPPPEPEPPKPDPPAPDPYRDFLDEYTNFGGPPPEVPPASGENPPTEEEHEDSKSIDLDTLIQACNGFLPLQPVRAIVSLREPQFQFTESSFDNRQLVADLCSRSFYQEYMSSCMYPVQEGNTRRYVSGPAFKRRRVWKNSSVDYTTMLLSSQTPGEQQKIPGPKSPYQVRETWLATDGIPLIPRWETGGTRDTSNLPAEVYDENSIMCKLILDRIGMKD